ncbi:FAD-dependent monooxygenase [Micromonospora sp. 4G57]|uniref:FAD-dependent monooxygenase n=1 Tax=Micromonospora sicca TaxID=2202420 RepID=A0ABU5JCR8_9ACTN|nr:MULTISPECIES: FAD-dependent monooxygenase [unclassified Micromonospora]MDZ5444478.1 FAD-dependent monooxygenase [Micromonospora sp. 4G57]MDZ5490362.1 FAD-dependent monooxygenase [Micromonospora sp. 4G53]
MDDRTVLISGAGIAGPALAYWLRRYGFHPTVVERSAGPRPGGQAVDVRGTAREVVDRMGLTARVRAECVAERGMAYVDARGEVTCRMPVHAFDGEGIVAEIEIERGDLARLLYSETRDGVEYLFDDSIESLTETGDGVRVTFERSAPRTVGLVVGADGVHSRTRSLAFGPESAYVRPLGAYLAYFGTPYPDDDGWFLMHNAPGGRVVGTRPTRHGRTSALFSFVSPPLELDRRDVAAQQRLLAERFADVGWRSRELLAVMADAPDFYFDLYGQVRTDRWSRGRVALLGDAAWCPSPLTGQGTSLSLVGAYVLAGELAAAGGDHPVAYRRYEEVLRAHVQRGQELPGGGISGFLPASRAAIRLRDASMRAMTSRPLRRLATRLFFSQAEGLALPEYAATG